MYSMSRDEADTVVALCDEPASLTLLRTATGAGLVPGCESAVTVTVPQGPASN